MILGKEISESLTLKFAQTARKLKSEGRNIISLGLGEPDFETPPEIIESAYKALKDGYTRYSSPQGLPEFRDKISQKLKKDADADYQSENIIVTPGAKNALFLSLSSLLEPGDEVINFTPYYVSYVPIAKIAEPQCRIINIKLQKDDLSFDPEIFKNSINKRTKAILLNSPNNPTGKIFSEDELNIIAEEAVKNDLYIISDEIYDELIFGDESHISIASINEMKERTFLVNGFSKSFSMTGWRIGYAAVPEKFRMPVIKLQQHINTNTAAFIQKAAETALGHDRNFLNEYRNKLRKRFESFQNFINNNIHINCKLPGAGFFAFADISSLDVPSNLFCSELLENTGVAVTPGIACGKEWDDHIRISLAQDITVLEDAFKLMDSFINEKAV